MKDNRQSYQRKKEPLQNERFCNGSLFALHDEASALNVEKNRHVLLSMIPTCFGVSTFCHFSSCIKPMVSTLSATKIPSTTRSKSRRAHASPSSRKKQLVISAKVSSKGIRTGYVLRGKILTLCTAGHPPSNTRTAWTIQRAE